MEIVKEKKLMIDEKSDDLEITSVGFLYRGGHWDKKYWSSSRGKDRYPYPVGYQAIRTHAGNTYRMEIREGLKGPVFVVISPDGDSYIGQTPDIAWENFQKKCCPKVKNWLGKRFSSKINGVELFGFRNPFVQRLLRELVANVNEVAERSLVAPYLYDKASKLDQQRTEESCTYPDLLPFLEKKQITGKRSLKKSSAENLIKERKIKRNRSQLLLDNRGCNESKESERDGGIHPVSKYKNIVHFQEEHLSTSKDGTANQVASSNFRNLQGDSTCILNKDLDTRYPNDGKIVGCASPRNSCDAIADTSPAVQVIPAKIVEENRPSLLSIDEVVMESKHSICFFKRNVVSREQSSDISHDQILAYASKVPLEKPLDVDPEQEVPLTSPKNRDGEPVDLARNPDVRVPDTCDTEPDSLVGLTLDGQKTSLCSMRNDLVLARPVSSPVNSLPQVLASKSNHDVLKSMHPWQNEVHVCTPVDTLSKGVIKDSVPEAGSCPGSSNQSSEKIDLDLAGQELARSMMTFLLPRAVPLLTKTYVKRSRHRNQENQVSPCSTSFGPNSAEQVENKQLKDTMSQGIDVPVALVQGSEVKIREKMNSPQELVGTNPLCQLTGVEPLLAGCTATEPFVESGSSKDIKCVIQDSFEDNQHVHDVSVKRQYSPKFDEFGSMFDSIKVNVNSPILHENNSGRPSFCSGNQGSDRKILLLDGINNENSLCNSRQTYVPGKYIPLDKAFSEECTNELFKVSTCEPNCLSSKCSNNRTSMDPHVSYNSSQLLNLQIADNAKVESHRFMPTHDLSRSDRVEHSYLGPCPNNKLGDEASALCSAPSHMLCSKGTNHSHSPNGQVKFDLHAATDRKDATVTNQVCGQHVTHVEQDMREDSIMKGKSSLLCQENVFLSGQLPVDSHNAGNISHASHSSKTCIIPVSDLIVCRNDSNGTSPELHFPQKVPDADENDQSKGVGNDAKISSTNEFKADEKLHRLIAAESDPASLDQDVVNNVTEDIEPSHFISPFVSSSINCVNSVGDVHLPDKSSIQSEEQTNALGSFPWSDLDPTIQLTTILDFKDHSQTTDPWQSYLDNSLSKMENSILDSRNSMELIGSYLHPNPVLALSLTSNEDGLQVCVLCGLVDSDVRNLFLYMIPAQGCRGTSPSFLGYTSLLSLRNDPCYRNVPFERSGLQFINGLQSLVVLNNVKAPRCLEQKFDCSCTTCTSNCCEENAVEIVHLNFGYVSSVIKLVVMERISSILACETNHLIAIKQSGDLHVWVMNLEWSVSLEEFMLPKFDELSPGILELKAIPNFNFLIIGHNCLGGFAMWDISKRVLLAKFSSPGIMTFQVLPVGLFKWQNQDTPTTCTEMDCIRETTFMLNNWCPKVGGDHSLALFEEDMGVWFLVSADSCIDTQPQGKELNVIPLGCWRLGLLVRNTVVLGSILDPRAFAACTSSRYGIYGTCDGFLYKWELSSGQILAVLHPFKCGSVSHIAVDAKSGAFAVADSGCQLLVYAPSSDTTT